MELKTFKDFIEEDFRSSLIKHDEVRNRKINFYFEKIILKSNENINLNNYMASFINREAYKFISNPDFGESNHKECKFLLVYYNKDENDYFCFFVFSNTIRHKMFTDMLDLSDKIYSPLKNYTKFYSDIMHDRVLTLDKNDIWLLPGSYFDNAVKLWIPDVYVEFLAKLGVPKKLGYDDDTWESLKWKY